MDAVKARVRVDVNVYVVEPIVTKQLGPDVSLNILLKVLSVTLFEKTPLNKWCLQSMQSRSGTP